MGAFKIKLPHPIDLGAYEVALTEIQYPLTWYNVHQAGFNVKFPDNVNKTVRLPDGRYEDVQAVVDAVQKQLQTLCVNEAIIVRWDKVRMKTEVQIRQDNTELLITPSLRDILGFDALHFTKGLTIGQNHADIDTGMTAIYVYSDIVQNQFVGDTLVPLLRVVPIRGADKNVYRGEEFLHPRYLPTKRETTSVMEFNLRTDAGKVISFKTGKVVLTLHFRALPQRR
jgi:hypothetical protein